MEIKKVTIRDEYDSIDNRDLDYFIYLNLNSIVINKRPFKVDNSSVLLNLQNKNKKFQKVFNSINFNEKLKLKWDLYDAIIDNQYEPNTHYFILDFFNYILPKSQIFLNPNWDLINRRFFYLFMEIYTNIEEVVEDFINKIEIELKNKDFVVFKNYSYSMFLYLYIKHRTKFKWFIKETKNIDVDKKILIISKKFFSFARLNLYSEQDINNILFW